MFQNKVEHQKAAFFWDILLGTYSPQLPHPSIFEITNTKLDLPQYRTLKMDIPRTRSQILQPSMHQMLEKIIVYFCQQEHISYKQGMNEIFAVVAIFNESGLSWEKVYEYARKIILDYNFFKDEEFLSLQVVFSWINLLLKFHDYELYEYLERNMLSPELYATPWILTLFANKMNLECTYLLWEILYIKNDNLMIYFIVVAVLLVFRDKILSVDQTLLPQTLTGIYIGTIDLLKSIYKKAVDIRLNTPLSSCIPIKIFDLPKQQLELLLDQYQQQESLTVSFQESQKLTINICKKCYNQGCNQCRQIKMPQEMKYFIQENKHLNELVQYIGCPIKPYRITEEMSFNPNYISILKHSKILKQLRITCGYVCIQQQQQQITNTEEDTTSTRSQNSQFNSQIIVPFKFNKILIQKFPQKQPDEQFESIKSSEESSGQPSVSYRQSSIIECNVLQNIRLNNVSPLEIQPLIIKKDSRANSLKQDPIKRFENKGLFKKIIIDISQIINNKYSVYKCKILGTNKQRILLINSGFMCLIKDEKLIYQKLLQIGQKIKYSFKTEGQSSMQIQYLYYLTFLKRISSKKLNGNIISFYFKQPIINSQQNINQPFFQIFKEFHNGLDNRIINEAKKLTKSEWKITFEMQNSIDAQNCIEMGKIYYKHCLL